MEMGEWIYIVIKYKRGKTCELLYRADEIIGRGDSLRMACIMMAEEWELGEILKWKRTKLYVLK